MDTGMEKGGYNKLLRSKYMKAIGSMEKNKDMGG